MPQGYYTIEQWTRPKKGSPRAWVEILHLPFGRSLTDAEIAREEFRYARFVPNRTNAACGLGGTRRRRAAAAQITRGVAGES